MITPLTPSPSYRNYSPLKSFWPHTLRFSINIPKNYEAFSTNEELPNAQLGSGGTPTDASVPSAGNYSELIRVRLSRSFSGKLAKGYTKVSFRTRYLPSKELDRKRKRRLRPGSQCATCAVVYRFSLWSYGIKDLGTEWPVSEKKQVLSFFT